MSYRGLLTLDADLGVPSSSTVDDYGNPVEDYQWTRIRTHLARRTSTEGAENLAADTMVAYFDPDALDLGLDAASRLRVAGVEWELAGTPIVARNPRTRAEVVHATVRRSEVT